MIKNTPRLSAIALAAATAVLGLQSNAMASSFSFMSGNYVPGTTAPEPLAAPDVLDISTASNKFFSGITFTNNGTTNWLPGASNVFIGGAGMVLNNNLFDWQADTGMTATTGGGTFNNSGTLRKSAGVGNSDLNNLTVITSGTFDVQTGTVRLQGGSFTVNSGSQFIGAGQTLVNTSSSFNGSFSSANLVLVSGTQTGANAVINGTVDWRGGNLSGTWEVAPGQNLLATTASNKIVTGAGVLSNMGNLAVAPGAGNFFLGGGSALANSGLTDFQGDTGITATTGGGSVNNSGTLRKSAGAGNSDLSNLDVVTNGLFDVQTGTLRIQGGSFTVNSGSQFAGAGQTLVNTSSSFNGSFNSANLVLNTGTQTGTNAVINGAVTWQGGNLTGTWEVSAGQDLLATTAANKMVVGAGVLANKGTMTLAAGASNFFLGGDSTLANSGLFNLQGDTGITATTGSGTVNNSGTLRKSAGVGNSDVSNLEFINSGTVDVQTGSLRVQGGSLIVNPGSQFVGAGQTVVSTSSSFNGSFSSSNLVLGSGTQTGNSAVINGTVGWQGGNLAGTWQVAPGQNLVALGASNKFISGAAVTNSGIVTLAPGSANVFLGGGASFVNDGQVVAQSDGDITATTGSGSFTNNGTFSKTAGTGTTSVSTVAFTNPGTVDVQVGTIQLPTGFSNPGTLKGNGTFAVAGTGLSNAGTVAPGASTGVLSIAGSFAQVAAGSLAIEITNLSSFDKLLISGGAVLDGTLALSCLGACSFAIGDTITILDAGTSLAGTFASVSKTGFATGAFDVVYNPTDFSVSLLVTEAVTAVPEPGTYAMLLAGLAVLGAIGRKKKA